MSLDRLRQILAFIEPGRYRLWAAYIGVGLMLGVLEAAASIALLGLLAIFNNAAGFTGRLVELVGMIFGGLDPAVGLGILVIVIYLVKSVAVLAQVYLRSSCVDGAFVGLSHRLLGNYLAAPYEFHLQRHSGELIKNINMAIELVARSVLQGVAAIVGEVFVILGLMAVALAVAPGLTLACMVVLAVYLAAIAWLTRGRARALGAEQQEIAKESQRMLGRIFDVIKEIKIHELGAPFAASYAALRQRQVGVLRRYEMLSIAPAVATELLVVVLVAGAAIGVVLTSNRDPALVALVGFFAYLILRLKPSVTRVATGINGIKYGMKAVDIIAADLALSDRDSCAAVPRTAPIQLKDTLSFRDVSYGYPGAERVALTGITLDIRRGETIGIVGPSGSGKSTLIEIVLGLLSPTSGGVAVDGKPIDCTGSAWHAGLGYVPQTICLLDDTIRRNIAFGIPDAEIDTARLDDAVRMAQLGEVVARLPQGLDTMLGEQGLGLSGGQRQRVAIARALYRKPQLLVFDEATSGLDHETETEVTAAIEKLYGAVTILIVAHRANPLRRCDRIVRMADGRVVDIEMAARARERVAEPVVDK